MSRFNLFRWHGRTQLDIEFGDGFLSVGLDRKHGWRPIAYWSPDATPNHVRARGWSPR